MSLLGFTLEFLLASVLLLASGTKLLRRDTWARLGGKTRLPLPTAFWPTLALAELMVGIALAIGFRPWAGLSASALFFSLAAGLTWSYTRGARGDCGCFGEYLPTRIGPAAIVRALVLAVLALVLVLIADPRESSHPAVLAGVLLVVVFAALVGSLRPMMTRR